MGMVLRDTQGIYKYHMDLTIWRDMCMKLMISAMLCGIGLKVGGHDLSLFKFFNTY
jgi:hypothetical protein